MYDMYPEWGPSHLREKAESQGAGQSATDPRDNGERPDDN